MERRRLTNAHDDEEARQEPAKVDDAAAGRLHKVIVVGGAPAEPVGQRRDYVGRDDEQRQVVLEEGGRQDDEQEAYREDLDAPGVSSVVWVACACAGGWLAYKGQPDDGLDAGHGGWSGESRGRSLRRRRRAGARRGCVYVCRERVWVWAWVCVCVSRQLPAAGPSKARGWPGLALAA